MSILLCRNETNTRPAPGQLHVYCEQQRPRQRSPFSPRYILLLSQLSHVQPEDNLYLSNYHGLEQPSPTAQPTPLCRPASTFWRRCAHQRFRHSDPVLTAESQLQPKVFRLLVFFYSSSLSPSVPG